MNLKLLCDFFESVQSAKPSEKCTIIENHLKVFKEESKKIPPSIKTTDDNVPPDSISSNFYQILRLIVPQLDRERPAYRIKESKIARIIIKMLDLPNGSHDKNILLKSNASSGSNFSNIICSILKKYISTYKSELTVYDLNNYLDQIAARQSDHGLDDLVLGMFRKSSPQGCKWIIQIILKDLSIGIGTNRILNCFHPDGAAYYATSSNLRRLCEALWDSQVKLHELAVTMFESFRPMLSKRCCASNFLKSFPQQQNANNRRFIVEEKFDGERFQLHMRNGQFKYFSRNGFDFTDTYGATFNTGLLTPLLISVFDDQLVQAVILDGEMMLWNSETRRFGSKGMALDVKKLTKGKYRPCFCVFDILLYNDRVVTNQPLLKRLKLLKNLFQNKQIPGTIMLSEYHEASGPEDIITALNQAVDRNQEGIIVKYPDSIYKCSDRNSGWYKIKLEYFDDVVHDLDLLIMGGYWGANKKLTSFLVGISSGKHHGDQTYLSFGSVSSGLSDLQIDLLNNKFDEHGTKTNPNIKMLLFGSETPDVYLDAKDSCILTVRASELTRSIDNRVRTPYTLRFPRVISVRSDKPVDECLSINELLQLCHQNKAVIKLNKNHLDINEIIRTTKDANRLIKAKKSKLLIIPTKQKNEIGNNWSNSIFKGVKFYVISVDFGTNVKYSLDFIYTLIKQAGGQFTFQIEPDINIVLVGDGWSKSLDERKKIEQFQATKRYDIVVITWLYRVFESKRLLDYNPDEILCYGHNNYKINLFGRCDVYGDSYYLDDKIESLERTFRTVTRNGDFRNVNNTLMFTSSLKNSSIYVGLIAYFDKFEVINDSNSTVIYTSFVDELEFRYCGGIVSDKITSDVNLVVTKSDDCDRREVIEKFLSDLLLGNTIIEIKSKSFLYTQ